MTKKTSPHSSSDSSSDGASSSNDVFGMAPSRDEIIGRQVSASSPTKASGSAGGGQTMLWFIVFLMIGAVVAGAWFGFKQFKALEAKLDNSQAELAQSTGDLESQLQQSGELKNRSEAEMRDTLKLHDSEIRKLWDVSFKKNKSGIDGNSSDIEKNSAGIASVSAAQKRSDARVKNQSAELEKISSLTQKQAQLISALEDKLSELEASNSKAVVALQARVSRALERDDLVDKVDANAVAIQSIDFFRKQTNDDLARINRDIRALNQRVIALP